MRDLKDIVNPNVAALQVAASSAGPMAGLGDGPAIRLDTNENPYNAPYNRRSDPCMGTLRGILARMRNVPVGQVAVANGMAGVVDMMYRCFCVPGVSNAVAMSPSREVYGRMARLNGVGFRTASLDGDFGLSVDNVLAVSDNNTRLIWLCSPNDPTGNMLDPASVALLLDMFDGLVVVDETYAGFARKPSWRQALARYANLVVVESMDYSLGAAALNVGVAYASEELVGVMGRVADVYLVSQVVQDRMGQLVAGSLELNKLVGGLIAERRRMAVALAELPFCRRVYDSEANFVLVRMDGARRVCDYLLGQGIAVALLPGGGDSGLVRITVGTKSDNNRLLAVLRGM